MKQRFKVIPAVYLLLEEDGKILLQRRHNTGYRDGYYSMAAGHLEGGESLVDALIREAEEELGITIKPADLEFVHLMHIKSEIEDSNEDERMTFYFKAHSYSGSPRIMEPEKCDELKWFPLDALPAKVIDHVKQAIDNVYNNVEYSEFGW